MGKTPTKNHHKVFSLSCTSQLHMPCGQHRTATGAGAVIMQYWNDPNLRTQRSNQRCTLLPPSSSKPKWWEQIKTGHLKWGLASFNSHPHQNKWCKHSRVHYDSVTVWHGVFCRVKVADGAHLLLSAWGCSPAASDFLPQQVVSWRFLGSA